MMDKEQAAQAVRKYVSRAWPVSSLTKDGCWRSAWAQSHIPSLGLIDFMNFVTAEGLTPRQYGENGPWILRLPGPSKKLAEGFLKCEGL